MKKLLLFCLPLALLFACGGEKPHDTALDYSKEGDGLVITQAKGVTEAYQKKFEITLTVKNNGKAVVENGLVKATYYDKAGDAVSEKSEVIKKALPAGESIELKVVSDIASVEKAPYRVKLVVGDMFN